MKVFLGGTCNGSRWREELIPLLRIDYFNPVVENWTPECIAEELRQRKECDICLYVITPKMTGVYSIAEVIEDSIKRPHKTLLAIMESDDNCRFNAHQWRSLQQVAKMAHRNGAFVIPVEDRNTIVSIANFLNGRNHDRTSS